MKYKNIGDQQMIKLLEDTQKKLTSGVERDSKVLLEMNNSLNWILTLMTLFLGIGLNYLKDLSHCTLNYQLLQGIKIIFFICIIILIIHKVVVIRYEKYKLEFLNILNTHELELKNNIRSFRRVLKDESDFDLVTFINCFRNGKFITLIDDERPDSILRFDRLIKINGSILKCSFWMAMGCFVINFGILSYLIMN